jgi:hypothetical protein
VARLDPRTGRLQARTTVPYSSAQPTIAGIVEGGVWIQNSSGMHTGVGRLSLGTLKPTPVAKAAVPANRAFARVIDGVVWLTESLPQGSLNYCVDPVTGQPRERLPILPGDSVMLAADASSIYFTDVPLNAHSVRLERAPISRNCTA